MLLLTIEHSTKHRIKANMYLQSAQELRLILNQSNNSGDKNYNDDHDFNQKSIKEDSKARRRRNRIRVMSLAKLSTYQPEILIGVLKLYLMQLPDSICRYD